MAVRVKLDTSKILGKVTNDEFGKKVSHEWKRLIDDYTPHDDKGELQRNVEELPFALHYKSPYAHYIYTGEVYVDPLYGVGGFYDPTYGWWSRPGITKIPSGRGFKHFNHNTNPKAIDHWDIAAENAGQKDELYRQLNGDLKRKT